MEVLRFLRLMAMGGQDHMHSDILPEKNSYALYR